MAAGGNGSNAWRLEDLQELALADELQTGLHLSGINTEFTDILSSLMEDESTQGLLQSSSTPLANHEPPAQDKTEFHCILKTPTAHTVKLDEPVVSYVNRGQLYELVMTHHVDDSTCMYKSMLSISFHNTKLKNCQQQLVEDWISDHPGDRMITLDQLSCDGVSDIHYPEEDVRGVVFNWSQHAVIALKIHCLSSEFTEKKHGGERGVPLQLLLNTWMLTADKVVCREVDRSYCLLKVFKDKGGDRKQKAEQQKSEKLPPSEVQKYLPCQPHTELQSICLSSSFSSSSPSSSSSSLAPPSHTPSALSMHGSQFQLTCSPSTPASNFSSPHTTQQQSHMSPHLSSSSSSIMNISSNMELQEWLARHRFTSLQPTFINYTGEDLLRLSRKDMMELCGAAEGIRLFNCLHSRTVRTLYVRLEHESVFQVICLEQLTADELCHQLALKLNISPALISTLLRRVLTFMVKVDDTVVQNMSEEQCFVIQIVKERESFQLVLVDPSEVSQISN